LPFLKLYNFIRDAFKLKRLVKSNFAPFLLGFFLLF